MYNSKVNAEGMTIPEVGIQKARLEDVKFENRLSFNFRQDNEALVTHSEFEANSSFDVEVQQTDTSRRVKHIANEAGIEFSIEDTDSFEDFSSQVIDAFKNKENHEYWVLFIYNKKGFVCLPKYPPFIQRIEEGKECTLKINRYNQGKLTRPEPDPEPETEELKKDPLPF